jgi:hypothetical protein
MRRESPGWRLWTTRKTTVQESLDPPARLMERQWGQETVSRCGAGRCAGSESVQAVVAGGNIVAVAVVAVVAVAAAVAAVAAVVAGAAVVGAGLVAVNDGMDDDYNFQSFAKYYGDV